MPLRSSQSGFSREPARINVMERHASWCARTHLKFTNVFHPCIASFLRAVEITRFVVAVSLIRPNCNIGLDPSANAFVVDNFVCNGRLALLTIKALPWTRLLGRDLLVVSFGHSTRAVTLAQVLESKG
jgi:hypothetical protein